MYDSRRDSGSSNGADYSPSDAAELEHAFGERGNTKRCIEEALKGLDVECTHLKGNLIRVSSIAENNAENTSFMMKDDKGEREVTVAEYFLLQYNIKLKYPRLPLVVSKRFKHESFFPMELLRIAPGQRIKVNKMSPTVQSAMTGRNASMPQHHVKLVQDILRDNLKLEQNKYMDAFGIKLMSTEPIQMTAKLLPPAQIKFKGQTYMPDMSRPAFRTQDKFVEPARIRKIGIVVFDNCIQMRQAEDFCDKLSNFCRDNGITVEKDSRDWSIRELNSSDSVAIQNLMKKWLDDRVDILVGIAREKKPDVHDILKYFEESIGLQTIQLCQQTVDKMMGGQGGRQTIDNVMRKFNLKCGGTNFFVEIPNAVRGKAVCSNNETLRKKLLEHVQFIGFEISHGASRTLFDRSRSQMDGEPSVVGVSYSLTNSTQLGGFTYLQTQKEYKLQKLDEFFPKCVRSYKEHSKTLPTRIVIYRVGAGEGNFNRVKEEVEEMRRTFDKIQPGYRPHLVVIIAQRASHARVFPSCISGNRATDQNIPSGTCVENVLTSYGYDEFILSSQTPLIGTVRPCKYTILVNDAKWSKNELMHLTYFRAFGHQVSYQPPSVPDVLYAAENLAKRGRNNYKIHQRYVNLQAVENRIIKDHSELINEDMREELAAAIVDEMSVAMNGMTIPKRNFWA